MARWLHAAAGNICSIMHWAIGFRELGWEVWITEHLSSSELGPPESPGRASPQEEYWKSVVEEVRFPLLPVPLDRWQIAAAGSLS